MTFLIGKHITCMGILEVLVEENVLAAEQVLSGKPYERSMKIRKKKKKEKRKSCFLFFVFCFFFILTALICIYALIAQ